MNCFAVIFPDEFT